MALDPPDIPDMNHAGLQRAHSSMLLGDDHCCSIPLLASSGRTIPRGRYLVAGVQKRDAAHDWNVTTHDQSDSKLAERVHVKNSIVLDGTDVQPGAMEFIRDAGADH